MPYFLDHGLSLLTTIKMYVSNVIGTTGKEFALGKETLHSIESPLFMFLKSFPKYSKAATYYDSKQGSYIMKQHTQT